MPFVEDFDEFKARMNCPYVNVDHGFLFENGGSSDGLMHSDPPIDQATLLKYRRTYLKTVLEQKEKHFRQVRNYINEQSRFHALGAGPPPEENAFVDLEELQAKVLELREKVMEVENTIKRMGPTPRELYEKRRAEASIAARLIQQRLQRFKI